MIKLSEVIDPVLLDTIWRNLGLTVPQCAPGEF